MVILEASFGAGSNCYGAKPLALAIPYQGGWALGSYSASRKSSVGVLFRIKPGWSRSREPITCYDITIASHLRRKLRQACSRWYNVLEVVETDNFTGRRLNQRQAVEKISYQREEKPASGVDEKSPNPVGN